MWLLQMLACGVALKWRAIIWQETTGYRLLCHVIIRHAIAVALYGEMFFKIVIILVGWLLKSLVEIMKCSFTRKHTQHVYCKKNIHINERDHYVRNIWSKEVTTTNYFATIWVQFSISVAIISCIPRLVWAEKTSNLSWSCNIITF